ncbi:MAG: type II toxin-antitoxin system HicB family antitoxin [Candidatus Delongbacteria bacterium]
METRKFTWYQEGPAFIGWLDEFPSYRTQAETLDELQENLRDLLHDLVSGEIPHVLHAGELKVA